MVNTLMLLYLNTILQKNIFALSLIYKEPCFAYVMWCRIRFFFLFQVNLGVLLGETQIASCTFILNCFVVLYAF